jgi:hypothetical protein
MKLFSQDKIIHTSANLLLTSYLCCCHKVQLQIQQIRELYLLLYKKARIAHRYIKIVLNFAHKVIE